ncbi:unnamed protein product [Phaedon cochleariae]|uniref:SWI/SNF-related matrix-associated actin-dependent regulator of chromatin subfamily A-like protein 1 n=1 Tax=Phaedon cochleariae TaxID=80249 RepID=A0A9P0DP71_PHACE|nr:unnamed protein product [Phaedon cochleariae]
MAKANQFYGSNPEKLIAKCSLISEERFVVEINGFCKEAIDIFKNIPSRAYDPKTHNWNFHIQDHDLVKSKLIPLRAKLHTEELPNYVLKAVRTKPKEVEIDFDKIDPILSSTLMPFQVEGLRFGLSKNGRCMIADDMGLGKTFQAMAIMHYYKEDWPLLIVTKSTIKSVWEETIANYLPSVPLMGIQYMDSGKDYIGDARILIVTHDMMTRSIQKLLDRDFLSIIIDESHILKSFKSKCCQAATLLARKARRVILLSGTPALSRPSELFTQLSLIDPQYFQNFFNFSKRYCDGKTTQFGWDANGSSNLQELEVILGKKFMIRRTKEQVLKGLPKKEREIHMLNTNLSQFPAEDRAVLEKLGQDYISQHGSKKHSLLLTFFSETAKIKVPSVCLYILQLLETKVKFLVFAHHQVMLDAIENVAKEKNVKYIRIDGKTSSDQRRYFINKFQLDDQYLCAILSITAANAGITLTSAQLVLFAELHWNPSILSQAEARAHRIGQEHPVVVRYLLAPHTADDSIWSLLMDKQTTLRGAGLCLDSFRDVEVQRTKAEGHGKDSKGRMDIRSFMTPGRKRKLESEEFPDDGLDDMLMERSEEIENSLDDGWDDAFCDIDI